MHGQSVGGQLAKAASQLVPDSDFPATPVGTASFL